MAYSKINNYLITTNNNTVIDICYNYIKNKKFNEQNEKLLYGKIQEYQTQEDTITNFIQTDLSNNPYNDKIIFYNEATKNEMYFNSVKKNINCNEMNSTNDCETKLTKIGFGNLDFIEDPDEELFKNIDCSNKSTLQECINDVRLYQQNYSQILFTRPNTFKESTLLPLDYYTFENVKKAFNTTKDINPSTKEDTLNEIMFQYIKPIFNCKTKSDDTCVEFIKDSGFFTNIDDNLKLKKNSFIDCSELTTLKQCKTQISQNLLNTEKYEKTNIDSEMYNEKKELQISVYRKTGNLLFGITLIGMSIYFIQKVK
jgi:hypothetical protein